MTCTHHMFTEGARCGWCQQIVTVSYSPAPVPAAGEVAPETLARPEVPAPAAIPAGGVAALREDAGAWSPVLHSPSPLATGGCADREAAPVPLHRPQPPVAPTLFGARMTDPDTSHDAAQAVTDEARRAAHALVLGLLADGPLSDFDLARLTGIKQTSVGVRRGELVKAGLVRRHDRAGVSDTGSPCIRWALVGVEVAA